MMTEAPKNWCFVVEFDEAHGSYRGSTCPKCSDDVAPERLRNPRDDAYRQRMFEQGACFRPALEDWYPCFYGGLVGILITPPTTDPPPKWSTLSPGNCSVVIMGADDTRMARECDSFEEACRIVRSLPCIIIKDDLIARGFHWD